MAVEGEDFIDHGAKSNKEENMKKINAKQCDMINIYIYIYMDM